MIKERIDKYYNEFKGLPSERSIVRNNQRDDAFEIVVLDVLYGKNLDFTFDKAHVGDIAKYIISPPDAGIDIFIEKGDADDPSFDVIQVKNHPLTEKQIRECFTAMERTVTDFCKNPLIVSENCRDILSSSNLDRSNRKSCKYFVVHTGDLKDFPGVKSDEEVLTSLDLQLIAKSEKDKVEEDILEIKSEQFMQFGMQKDAQNAVVCSINGYQLAELNNRYYSTEIGRNILFGHNLRESLNPKSSKSFRGMKDTIKNCPENFWYYNNGITIIAEDVTLQKDSSDNVVGVKLSRFSIVNGAQTTSSLGLILKEANQNRDESTKEALKQVYVIARILKVDNSETENAIAIYNNTQNPITYRDMVANNKEQKDLYNRLIDSTYPQIYMEIRRGAKTPQEFNKGICHRKTTNESLAQLAYAGFLLQPHTAKDKKSALFYTDYSSDYTVNEIYHRIFNHQDKEGEATPDNNGILFQKDKNEIDELLFSQELYKRGKKYLREEIQKRIQVQTAALENAEETQKKAISDRIERNNNMLDAIGICMFYFVTTYYEYKAQFGTPWNNYRYDFDKFYNDSQYQSELVEATANFFLTKTAQHLIETARKNGKSSNINNWIRSASCQDVYLDALRSDIGFDLKASTEYENLMKKYKTVPI